MNKEKIINSKNIILGIMIIIVIIINIVMYSKFIYNERSYYKDDYITYDSRYELEGKNEIRQEFVAKRDGLESVIVGFDKSFRTYSKDKIKIQVIDTTNNTVLGEYDSIYNAPVQNEKEYKFVFQQQKESNGKKYEIVIIYEDGTTGNPLLYSKTKQYEEGRLTVNGVEEDSNISFAIVYNSRYANVIFGISLTAMTILTIAGLVLVTYKKISIEKIMVIMVSVLGLAYVFVVPMYRGHDEHAHFFRAYEISRGVFNTKIIDHASITEIPSAFLDVLHEDYNKEERYINATYYDDIIRSRNVNVDSTSTNTVGGEYMAVYSPIPYIPQAIAIKVTSIFTNNLLVQFYMARIVNLLVSIAILYVAIKIIPFGKKIILFVVLIPTTLSQIASLSPDALTITSTILYIAYALKVIKSEDKINWKNTVILATIGLVMGLCKIVYMPIVLIALLTPKAKFNNFKKRIIYLILTILVPAIGNLLWLGVAGVHLALIDCNKSAVQTVNILSNPFEYIRICFYTLYYQFDLYLQQLFGGLMQHVEKVNVGWINVIAYVILFVFVILFDESSKKQLDRKEKTAISIILFIICCLIFTSIYMQWSSLKWYFINGIQGRYFVELLLPFMLVLAQNNLVAKNGKINLEKIILYSSILLNMIAIMCCVITYI